MASEVKALVTIQGEIIRSCQLVGIASEDDGLVVVASGFHRVNASCRQLPCRGLRPIPATSLSSPVPPGRWHLHRSSNDWGT